MKIGSLFSGTGGLDMGVQAALGGDVVWNVEYDEAPSKILEHHWPGIPNYGDVTTVDWTVVEPIDALTAGYPCQPFSQAGKRKGSNDERHLWPYVLDAVRHLRPGFVILENVRGHLSLGFDRVLGDLAEVGYDAGWLCIPASAAGAPHGRERVFILAQDANGAARDQRGLAAPEQAESGRSWADAGGRDRAPATDSERGVGIERHGGSEVGGWADPTEQTWVGDRSYAVWRRDIERAIHRWEPVIGRIAPATTLPDGRGGNDRLNTRFVEWMMGLPAGHVTDVGLTRNEELKALGNGVVPQQAALALSLLLGQARSSLETK